MLGLLFLTSQFNLLNGIGNYKSYFHSRKSVIGMEHTLNKYQQQLINERNTIQTQRQKLLKNPPNLDDANGIVESIKSLKGIKHITADVISVNNANGEVTNIGPLPASVQPGTIQGIQITVECNNIKDFLQEFNKLYTPCATINVMYPSNTVVIRYIMQGGVIA